jgi:flagellin
VTSFIAAFNTQLAAAANPASDSVDIATIDSAINNVSAAASTFGAVQNRLSYTLSNNTTYAENLSAATSHIEDTNMASEMSLLTMDQVLQQAGVAVLSQANHAAQSVLTLIQNG